MAIVKKGFRYFYNSKNGAVYGYSPDLAAVSGLVPFTATEDGNFTIGMTMLGNAKPKAQNPPKAAKSVKEPIDRVPEKTEEELQQERLRAEAAARLEDKNREERGNEDGSRENAHEAWIKAQAETAKQAEKSESLDEQHEAGSDAEAGNARTPVKFAPVEEPK